MFMSSTAVSRCPPHAAHCVLSSQERRSPTCALFLMYWPLTFMLRPFSCSSNLTFLQGIMNVSSGVCLSRSSPSLAKPSKFSQSLPPLLPGRKTAKQQNTACSNVWHIQVIPQQPGERAGTRLQHRLRLRRIKRRSAALASFSLICFRALFPGRS